MKNEFIQNTKNIQELLTAMDMLTTRNLDIPGLGLVHGKAGYGKTKAVQWYATQFDCPYIRAKAIWTPKSMLQDICAELEMDPEKTTLNIFRQIQSELTERSRLIIIDEADYLTTNKKLLETLRDIHDITGSSFVLVGMGEIRNKLYKHRQFWSRISQVIEFEALSLEEISFIASKLADLSFDKPSTLEEFKKLTKGFFRDTCVGISHLERMTKSNETDQITFQMIVALSALLKGKKS